MVLSRDSGKKRVVTKNSTSFMKGFCLSPFKRAVSEAHVMHVGRRIWNMEVPIAFESFAFRLSPRVLGMVSL